jgi:hypothetical protein
MDDDRISYVWGSAVFKTEARNVIALKREGVKPPFQQEVAALAQKLRRWLKALPVNEREAIARTAGAGEAITRIVAEWEARQRGADGDGAAVQTELITQRAGDAPKEKPR